jgi:hypothetical protein
VFIKWKVEKLKLYPKNIQASRGEMSYVKKALGINPPRVLLPDLTYAWLLGQVWVWVHFKNKFLGYKRLFLNFHLYGGFLEILFKNMVNGHICC